MCAVSEEKALVIPPSVVPTGCPFCASADVHTVSKAITVSTYWRCAGCGQIWNVERTREARPPGTRRW